MEMFAVSLAQLIKFNDLGAVRLEGKTETLLQESKGFIEGKQILFRFCHHLQDPQLSAPETL